MLNPILEREMRARFRGKRSYMLLSIFVLLEIGVFLLALMSAGTTDSYSAWMSGRSLGRRLFDGFATVLVMLVGLFTPASAASAISSEREKRTLEFLELTLLTPREIVAGKLAVALFYVGILGVTALPVVSLVFVLGGVSPQHVLALYAVLALLALATGSIGIWVSAWSKTTVGATVMAYAWTMLAAPFWAMVLDRPFSRGGSNWARLLTPEIPWFGTQLRPLTLLAIPVVLLSNVLVQNAAGRMANPETHRPRHERLSVWLAFAGLLALAAGLFDAARKPLLGSGLPGFLVCEAFLLGAAVLVSTLGTESRAERQTGFFGSLARVADVRSIGRARVLGEPWFMLVLCLTGAVIHVASAGAVDRANPQLILDWAAFHGLMIAMAGAVSLAMTAAVSVWERWMPDLPRIFRVGFVIAVIWSLFAAEFLHWSVMRKDTENPELSSLGVVLAYLSPFKALHSLDASLATPTRLRRNLPGYDWGLVAAMPPTRPRGWVGTLSLYGGMAVAGAFLIGLAHRQRAAP